VLKWRRKNLWRKKEKSDAKSFFGHRTPRSGGLWNCPGDVKTDDFLLDCKHTDKKSFSVSEQIMNKVHMEALKSSKIPGLSVELGDGNEFIVLRKQDFLTIINLWKTKQ
jgi:hypothetical protein